MPVRPDLILLLAAMAWTAAVVLAPLIDAAVIYAAAGIVCHQLPDRSFHLMAGPIAVCARCLGLYIGGLAGIVAGPLFGVTRTGLTRLTSADTRIVMALAAFPTALTLIAEWLLAWPTGNVVRFAAALPLGAAAAFVIAAAIAAEWQRRVTAAVAAPRSRR